MKKMIYLPLALACLSSLTSAPVSANWVHFSDSVFDAQGGTIKHPAKLTRVVNLATAAVGDQMQLCIGYVGSFEKKNAGKIVGTATATDPDDNVETVSFSGRVGDDGTFGQCEDISALPAGTIIVFDVRFKQFGRLRNQDRFQIGVAVAIDGANPFQRQARFLSDEDEAGIKKMAEWAGSGRGVALRREGSGWTVDWRIDGQGFELPRTYGQIATAIAAWCRAIGL